MKVLGIGDNVVDKYVHLKTMYPGGNALNFSVFAQKKGVESAFIGTFGNDKEAEYVESVLKELQIDISRCRHATGENGCARVTLENGDRVFLGSNDGGVTRENLLKLTEEDKVQHSAIAFPLANKQKSHKHDHKMRHLIKHKTNLHSDIYQQKPLLFP